MNQDAWIIEVRKCITKAQPKITVGEIMDIFDVSSPSMDLFVEDYCAGKTPQQAFEHWQKTQV